MPKNWCFQTVVLVKTPNLSRDSKEIKPVNPKGNQPWIFIANTGAEAPILWPPDAKSWLTEKDPDAGKDWGQEKKLTEDEMVEWHHRLNGHELEQTMGDDEGQGSLVCCRLWGRKDSDMTQWLNKNKKALTHSMIEKEIATHSSIPAWRAHGETSLEGYSLSSVQYSHSVVSDSLPPHESQHARPPCPLPSPRVYSNSRPSSQWCHPAITSSVVPFSSCPQSFPASVSFPISQLFTWGGQIIGVSASASVLQKNTENWSPLGWIGWISLQSKGLSRVFSNTTVQKHQFFGAQLSSQSNSHIHTWPLEKP